MPEIIIGKFKKYAHFGFIIPENRELYGGDFFVSEKNSKDAKDGETVTGHILVKSKGKKPEAKIVKIGKPSPKKLENIVGIYSDFKGDFGLIDVEGQEKGFFVFKKDNMGACDGDLVEAKLKIFRGKKEAVVIKILKNDKPLIKGVYKDTGNFGFVIPEKGSYKQDIFIAGSKKMDAKSGDKVEVQIIKETGRRPEGVIKKIG